MYEHIVVGTDGSATASKAVGRAADLAAAASATLVIVSAFRPVPEERLKAERSGAPKELAYVGQPARRSRPYPCDSEEIGRDEGRHQSADPGRGLRAFRSTHRRGRGHRC